MEQNEGQSGLPPEPDAAEQPKVLIPPKSPNSGRGSKRVRAQGSTFSPLWTSTTKLVMGLTLAAMLIFLLFRFLNIVGPLLLAFLLAYLVYPIADLLHRYVRLPWRIAVTLLYLVMMIVMVGSLAVSGLAIVEQVQSLINFLQTAVEGLPATIQTFLTTPISIGPFTFQPGALEIDANTISQQLLAAVQPTLTGAGTLVGTFASSAVEVIGWTFFILLISYFILSESVGFPNLLTNLSLPGYAHDLQRLSDEVSRIWNAFLRGQLTVVLLVIFVYTFVLGSLGMKFFIGLALVAGLARFVPFVGSAISWTTYGIVAFFQGTTIFGLSPLGYVALVVGSAWVIDMCIDNLLSPRIMADALRVHPAAVMVFALIGANLLGFIGVVLAAPVLATVQLFLDYIIHKLLDQDPWENLQVFQSPGPLPPIVPEVRKSYRSFWDRISKVRFPWLKKT